MNISAWIDPFYLGHRALLRDITQLSAGLEGTLVDVGCGAKPYASLFPRCIYVGLEVAVASEFGSAKRPDVYYDGSRIPISDGSADVILSTQVLEHVFEPDGLLAEMARICRPGATLLLTVPFVWDEHEQPFDFARYSSFGLTHLLHRAGFRVIEHRRTLADASIFAQLWLAYVYKVTLPLPRNPRRIFVALVSLFCNVLGHALSVVLPANADLFLDNVVLAVKVQQESAGDGQHGTRG